MPVPLIVLLLGLAVLVWSADRFVGAAAATASRAGMSRLLVGMTVVALGTSAPEIVVSTMASLDGICNENFHDGNGNNAYILPESSSLFKD